MKRFVLIAGLCLLGAGSALAAAPKFKMAADGSTNIKDCAAVAVEFRNECISRARPVTAKEIYGAATAAAKPAKVDAATEKAKRRAAEKAARLETIRYNKARVASAPKGLKVNSDGTTNIADCGKVAASLRDVCISRARPLGAKALAQFTKERTAAEAKAAAKLAAAAKTKATTSVAKAEAVKPAAKAEAAKPLLDVKNAKGFAVAKDGTTNIADCAKAKPEFKNECISRARPVSGAEIYGKKKSGS